jgi:hypothetical protein
MGGKSFRSQKNNWSCGILSIQNSIRALNCDADYDDIKRLSRANSKDGTSTRGVLRALRALGFNAVYYKTRNAENAIRFARKWATLQPLIISCDSDTHWATITGSVNDMLILVDSGLDASGEDKGVYPLARQQLLERWLCRGWYKAIRVSRM